MLYTGRCNSQCCWSQHGLHRKCHLQQPHQSRRLGITAGTQHLYQLFYNQNNLIRKERFLLHNKNLSN